MSFQADDLSQYLDTVYRYALSSTGNPDLAADICQDTFLKALERKNQYRGEAPLHHWLIRIAHNLIIDRGRRSSREVVVDNIESEWKKDEYTVEADEVLEAAATREALLDALVRLPFIYRSAVILHDIEGLKVAEIAAIAEIGLPAAKQRLRRGRMAMVSALDEANRRRRAMEGVPMRCWDARKFVSEYINRSLDQKTANMVEAHLRKCPTCPPLYASLVGVQGELGRLRDDDNVVAPKLAERIRSVLSTDEGVARRG